MRTTLSRLQSNTINTVRVHHYLELESCEEVAVVTLAICEAAGAGAQRFAKKTAFAAIFL